MLFCHVLTVFIVCTHTGKLLYYSCFTAVFLQLRFEDHSWCYSALFLPNRCLSHQQFKPQFPYFCYSVHPYCKIIVLFLSYSSLSNITTQIWWSYLILFCHVLTFFLLWATILENDCIIVFLQVLQVHLTGKMIVFFLSYSSLFYIATQIWWSYLMLFCHVITVLIENDCIILVLQLSFYNSDLIIIFDVILPCPYCFYCVHSY